MVNTSFRERSTAAGRDRLSEAVDLRREATVPTFVTLFSGNSSRDLAAAVAERMRVSLGRSVIGQFSDGEVSVEIEENVRARHVFVLQSICRPTNDNLMEYLLLVDALRRASAASITGFFPYLGYARQDRRPRSARVPITAKMVADMIARVGTDRIITLDLHADQIQGFFEIPIDNLSATPILLGDIWKQGSTSPVVVSPDIGGVVRARTIAHQLDDADLAIIDKRRPRANEAEVMNIIGEVDGRHCLIIDDMVDTAGTLCKAAAALKDRGATRVSAYCTHGILSGRAVSNLSASALDELVVTDTIPLEASAQACPVIRVLSVADLVSETISRLIEHQSLSSMFGP